MFATGTTTVEPTHPPPVDRCRSREDDGRGRGTRRRGIAAASG